MKLLLDTSVLIYADSKEKLLKPQTLELIGNSEILISAVSVWEIIQKHKLGKLHLRLHPAKMVEELMDAFNASFLDFTALDALNLEKLPEIHKDPFDRMLICQSINNGVAIVTDDKEIAKYPIRTIW